MYSVVTPAMLCVGHWSRNTHPNNNARNAAIRFIRIIPLHFSFRFLTRKPPRSIPPPAPGTVIIPETTIKRSFHTDRTITRCVNAINGKSRIWRCACSVKESLKYIKVLSHRERCVKRCSNATNGKIRTLYILMILSHCHVSTREATIAAITARIGHASNLTTHIQTW